MLSAADAEEDVGCFAQLSPCRLCEPSLLEFLAEAVAVPGWCCLAWEVEHVVPALEECGMLWSTHFFRLGDREVV